MISDGDDEHCPEEERTAAQTITINGDNICPVANPDSGIIAEDDSVTVSGDPADSLFLGNKLTGLDGVVLIGGNYQADTDLDDGPDPLSITDVNLVVGDEFDLTAGPLDPLDVAIVELDEMDADFVAGSVATFKATIEGKDAFIYILSTGEEFLINPDDAFSGLGGDQDLTFNFTYVISDGDDEHCPEEERTAAQTITIEGEPDIEFQFEVPSNLVLYLDDGADNCIKIKFEGGQTEGGLDFDDDGIITDAEIDQWLLDNSNVAVNGDTIGDYTLVAFSIKEGKNNELDEITGEKILHPGEGQLVWLADGVGEPNVDPETPFDGTEDAIADDVIFNNGMTSDIPADSCVLDVLTDAPDLTFNTF